MLVTKEPRGALCSHQIQPENLGEGPGEAVDGPVYPSPRVGKPQGHGEPPGCHSALGMIPLDHDPPHQHQEQDGRQAGAVHGSVELPDSLLQARATWASGNCPSPWQGAGIR